MSKWKFPQDATMTFIAMLLLAGCVSQQKYDASQQSMTRWTQNISNSTRRCRRSRRQPDADHAIAKRH